MKIKKGDFVLVNAGRDRGLTGEVVLVLPKLNKIAVNGINLVKKTVKPSKENPTGGFIEKNGLLDVSNVTLLNDKKQVVKVSYSIEGKSKSRVLTAKSKKESKKVKPELDKNNNSNDKTLDNSKSTASKGKKEKKW